VLWRTHSAPHRFPPSIQGASKTMGLGRDHAAPASPAVSPFAQYHHPRHISPSVADMGTNSVSLTSCMYWTSVQSPVHEIKNTDIHDSLCNVVQHNDTPLAG
jgi:hypothetical protein